MVEPAQRPRRPARSTVSPRSPVARKAHPQAVTAVLGRRSKLGSTVKELLPHSQLRGSFGTAGAQMVKHEGADGGARSETSPTGEKHGEPPKSGGEEGSSASGDSGSRHRTSG